MGPGVLRRAKGKMTRARAKAGFATQAQNSRSSRPRLPERHSFWRWCNWLLRQNVSGPLVSLPSLRGRKEGGAWEKEVFARGRVDNGALLKFWGVNNREEWVAACDQPDFAWRLAWPQRLDSPGRGPAGVTRDGMTNTHVIVAPEYLGSRNHRRPLLLAPIVIGPYAAAAWLPRSQPR